MAHRPLDEAAIGLGGIEYVAFSEPAVERGGGCYAPQRLVGGRKVWPIWQSMAHYVDRCRLMLKLHARQVVRQSGHKGARSYGEGARSV